MSRPADAAAACHTFVQLYSAAGIARQQREIELTDLRMLHGEVMKDAVARFDRGSAFGIQRRSRVIAELIHALREFLDAR